MKSDDVTLDVIYAIVERFEYIDVQYKMAATDAVNNSVYSVTYFSDLCQTAAKFAITDDENESTN